MKFFILITMILFWGCNGAQKTTEEKLVKGKSDNFEILLEQPYGGKEERGFQVYHTAESFRDAFSSPLLNETIKNRIDQLDFDKKAIVVLHSGLKNTGGYGITISEVATQGNTTYITVKETSPDPGMPVTMALTHPFCIAIIDKSEEVIFQ